MIPVQLSYDFLCKNLHDCMTSDAGVGGGGAGNELEVHMGICNNSGSGEAQRLLEPRPIIQ